VKYIKLVISIEDEYQESLITELSDMEFDSFQQLHDELITYIPKEQFQIGDRERIERLLAAFPGEVYVRSEEIVADQNWNMEWEKTIQAQEIGLFLVRPTWSTVTPEADQILLEIDPKMSFGTGYHETTRLMLKQLSIIINKGDLILDAGTGTGILAIASIKLGAKKVIGFDTDDWSITNASENILLNKVADKIDIKKGSMEVIKGEILYDGILANIERNTITEMLPNFSNHLKKEGTLLISGILEDDEELVTGKLNKNNFEHIETMQENEWIAIWAKKVTP
jgi:ribosomal protein L11 methyltransferase